MNLRIFITLFIACVLLLFTCKKEEALDPNQVLFNNLCMSSNGELNIEIDGKSWGNSCAIAYGFQVGQTAEDSVSLAIISYTGKGIFLNDGSFEWFSMQLFIEDGIGSYDLDADNGGACYSSGLIEWTGGTVDPDAEFTEEKHYCTDNDIDDNNRITVEFINGTRIKGSFDFTVFNEDGESLEMKGDFDVDYGG